jgi:hypothetical protein
MVERALVGYGNGDGDLHRAYRSSGKVGGRCVSIPYLNRTDAYTAVAVMMN